MNDREWLENAFGRELSDHEQYDFTERIGIKIDSGIDQLTARNQAIEEDLYYVKQF